MDPVHISPIKNILSPSNSNNQSQHKSPQKPPSRVSFFQRVTNGIKNVGKASRKIARTVKSYFSQKSPSEGSQQNRKDDNSSKEKPRCQIEMIDSHLEINGLDDIINYFPQTPIQNDLSITNDFMPDFSHQSEDIQEHKMETRPCQSISRTDFIEFCLILSSSESSDSILSKKLDADEIKILEALKKYVSSERGKRNLTEQSENLNHDAYFEHILPSNVDRKHKTEVKKEKKKGVQFFNHQEENLTDSEEFHKKSQESEKISIRHSKIQNMITYEQRQIQKESHKIFPDTILSSQLKNLKSKRVTKRKELIKKSTVTKFTKDENIPSGENQKRMSVRVTRSQNIFSQPSHQNEEQKKQETKFQQSGNEEAENLNILVSKEKCIEKEQKSSISTQRKRSTQRMLKSKSKQKNKEDRTKREKNEEENDQNN